MDDVVITPLTEDDLTEALPFCDREIGDGYYSLDYLRQVLKGSQKDGETACFIARNNHGKGDVVAIRLTYAPGHFLANEGRGTTPEKWRVDKNSVGYFKSLFIAEDYRGGGLGGRLSGLSIEALKKQGAKAVMCHSWMQSPGNSSKKYLLKMGFESVKEHPLFWHDVDYRCTGCLKDKCTCSAEEMIKYF